jgi:hypothetical protein
MMRNFTELMLLAVEREQIAGNKTFIVVKQALESNLRRELTQAGHQEGVDFEIAHYYGLTGSNKYEECDAVILFGKPALPQDIPRAKQELTGINSEVFAREKREGELRDALHRIRPARKDRTRAYILTSTPNFESDFGAGVERYSVPDFRSRLRTAISEEETKQAILDLLKNTPTPLRASEICEEVEGDYAKVNRLISDLLDFNKVVMSKHPSGGRPAKKYSLRSSEDG